MLEYSNFKKFMIVTRRLVLERQVHRLSFLFADIQDTG